MNRKTREYRPEILRIFRQENHRTKDYLTTTLVSVVLWSKKVEPKDMRRGGIPFLLSEII